jgi:hypothetical protein
VSIFAPEFRSRVCSAIFGNRQRGMMVVLRGMRGLRMKVIFLDIDGVLINNTSLLMTETVYVPDKKCVQLLSALIKQTDAKIVASSCWRIGRTLAELRKILSSWGVTGIILDKTPNPFKSREKERGLEIQHWLEKRNKSRADVESFVILDDNSHTPAALWKFLVQTKFEAGLTPRDTTKALRILLKGGRYESQAGVPRSCD